MGLSGKDSPFLWEKCTFHTVCFLGINNTMCHLKLSPLIGNNAVLQEGVPVPVRGEALPEAEITVSFMGKTYQTRSEGGKWRVLLDSQVSGGPHTMEITARESGVPVQKPEKISIENIYIGDVWICSGQSNMELPMQRLKDNYPEEWGSPNPLIRQFKVSQEWDFSGPRPAVGGSWASASGVTLDGFSGTAWFFANAIFENHHTPIGLINAAWGGTPAEAWMSRGALAAFPEKLALANLYADTALCDEIIRKNAAEVKAWQDQVDAADDGMVAEWHRPETDVSLWSEMNLPGNFSENEDGLANFCGVIWLRREFNVNGEFLAGESKIWLGTIVDADTVFINGICVGNTTYRYPPRKYTVPAGLLREGKNTVVIRVVCCNGQGGVTKDKDFRIFSEKGNIELSGTWKYRVGARAEPRPEEFFFQRQPTGLFNAMIAPILDFPCKGVIWYQGESNDRNPREYGALFPALINDWRAQKQQPDLPFLFVQLPVWGAPEENNESSSWAIIREAQCSALALPFTGMAAGLDLGEWNDLHPLNKKDIGRRLALAAEKLVFKKSNTAPGPMLRGIERRGEKLLLTFDNCGKGLTAREKPHVSVMSGGNLIRLPAVIESPECLSVDISSVKNPEKVLYAWASNPRDRQLYNADGLPMVPFRVDLSNE
jgi:sialate O-acetylesterase